jgi:hypothetical protein
VATFPAAILAGNPAWYALNNPYTSAAASQSPITQAIASYAGPPAQSSSGFDPYAGMPTDFYYSPGASPGWGTPASGYFDPYAGMPADFYYSPGYSAGAAQSPVPQSAPPPMANGGGLQGLAQMLSGMGGQQGAQQPAAQPEQIPEPPKTFDQLHPNGTASGANYKDPRDQNTWTGGGAPAGDSTHGNSIVRDMLSKPEPTPRTPTTPPLPGNKPLPADPGDPSATTDPGDGSKPGKGSKGSRGGGYQWPSFGGGGGAFGAYGRSGSGAFPSFGGSSGMSSSGSGYKWGVRGR